MIRMTGPDCAVMCNLINTHTYIHTYDTIYLQLPMNYMGGLELRAYYTVFLTKSSRRRYSNIL